MEDLFALLKTPSRLPEGTLPLPPAAPAGGAWAHQPSSSNGAAEQLEEGRPGGGQEWRQLEERQRSHGAASSSSSTTTTTNGSSGGKPGLGGLRLELQDVWFGYDGASRTGGSGSGRPVLRGVSLAAEPGESIAVVGECWGGAGRG